MTNLKFTIGDEKGYISLDAMRFKENDIEAFKDRSYTNIEYTDSLIEIYDTSSFYDDFPEESLSVVTKDIKDNKLNLDLKINADFLNVSIEGYIDIKNKKYVKAID